MHTQNKMIAAPFVSSKGVVTHRVIVKQVSAGELTIGDIVLPEISTGLLKGEVISASEGSGYAAGDTVFYSRIERNTNVISPDLFIDGERFAFLNDFEIWFHNGNPVNRIFVKPLSQIQVGEDGIITPTEVSDGVMEGSIVLVHPKSPFAAGDKIVYRRNVQRSYPVVVLNGESVEVLADRDVYTCNGNVSPYRMIVRIDMRLQAEHRSREENGLLLHPSFIHMKRNLQWGRLMDVGEHAAKMYPGCEKGKYIAFHHFVEHHAHRLLSTKCAQDGTPLYEYRIIDCLEHGDHEVFALLSVSADMNNGGKLTLQKIHPYDDVTVCDWTFNVVESEVPDETIGVVKERGFSAVGKRDLEELMAYVDRRRGEITNTYKNEYNQHTATLQRLSQRDPYETDPSIQSEIRAYEEKRNAIQAAVLSSAKVVNKNHLVVLRISQKNPNNKELLSDNAKYLVTTYRELYPISLMGNRYLFAYDQLILGTLETNIKNNKMAHTNNFMPTADQILIRPIEEKKSDSGIIIPEELRIDQPTKGIAVAVGPGKKLEPMLIPVGAEVHFIPRLSKEIMIDGEPFIIVKQNDTLGHIAR